MRKIFTAALPVIAAATVVFSGCEGKSSDKVPEKGIIPGITTGMTSDEVFAVVGSKYDNKLETETYKKTVEYEYTVEPGEAFGTDIGGYMFFEFDSLDDTLVTYGYHLGQSGSYEAPTYPYTAGELKSAYDTVMKSLSEWYGEGSESRENADYGVTEEYSWQTDGDKIWAIYGVNLWAVSEPLEYEYGLNEIVISCSSAIDLPE